MGQWGIGTRWGGGIGARLGGGVDQVGTGE